MTIQNGSARPAGRAPDGREASGALTVRPGVFCGFQLQALEAAESQTRRRKRDQSPDRVGLGIKRELLERAVADDPAPDAFEGWLMQQVLRAPHAGAVLAMCQQIFLEYQMAAFSPELAGWLAAGAPSDDAEPERRPRERGADSGQSEGWRRPDDPRIACTCHPSDR